MKVHNVDGKQKVVGFDAPDGKYYTLAEGEELIHINSPKNDGNRDTFISKDGQNIPFEIWKQGKKMSN